MASTINVLTTGVGGIQQTGDTSGILQMQKDGTATLTVDASGNVGIGTASPTQLLYLKGGTQVNQYIESTGNATNSIYQAGADGSSAYVFNRSNLPLTFGANNLERLRIGTSGEIGLSGANYGTSGQFLTSNGPGAAASWTTAAAGGFSNMTVFTSPGTFTTPSTTTKIKVTVVGGGGNGGAAGANGGNSSSGGGGGGGGGAAIYVGPVTASTGYPITVGSAGGTSSFGVLASATGGSAGGTGSPGSGPTNVAGSGGAAGGGTAGTFNTYGTAGCNSANGGPAGNGQGGAGGASLLGGGGGQPGGAGTKGGGGGGGTGNSTAGGAGGAGVVIVEY